MLSLYNITCMNIFRAECLTLTIKMYIIPRYLQPVEHSYLCGTQKSHTTHFLLHMNILAS